MGGLRSLACPRPLPGAARAVNLPRQTRHCHNRHCAPLYLSRLQMPTHTPALSRQIAATIASEIGAAPAQALAAIALLDEGATVPFIARYRKEVTGGLDDTQLRNLETRLTYLRELEDRRAAVLASI